MQGEKRDSTGVMLGILSAIERDSSVTQRLLARELGIAVGLANAYLRRCTRKGLVKVRQVPLNRYAYYLTPRGFAEKSRLVGDYLALSFNFFREARRDAFGLLHDCAARGWLRVALVGMSELAEITALGANEAGIKIIAVVDPSAEGLCAGAPVLRDLKAPGPVDAFIVTDVRAPQACFNWTLAEAQNLGFGPDRVLAPALLHITPGLRP